MSKKDFLAAARKILKQKEVAETESAAFAARMEKEFQAREDKANRWSAAQQEVFERDVLPLLSVLGGFMGDQGSYFHVSFRVQKYDGTAEGMPEIDVSVTKIVDPKTKYAGVKELTLSENKAFRFRIAGEGEIFASSQVEAKKLSQLLADWVAEVAPGSVYKRFVQQIAPQRKSATPPTTP